MADALTQVALAIATDLVRPMQPLEAQTAVLSHLERAGFGAAFLRLDGDALRWEMTPAYMAPATLSDLQSRLQVVPVPVMPLALDSVPDLPAGFASLPPQFFHPGDDPVKGSADTDDWKTVAAIMRALDVRRNVRAPVVHEGRALGLLVVWSDTLASQDCEIIGVLGRMLGAALSRGTDVPLDWKSFAKPAGEFSALQSVIAALSVDQPLEQSLTIIRDAMPGIIPGVLPPVFALRDLGTDQWNWKTLFPAAIRDVILSEAGNAWDDLNLAWSEMRVWNSVASGEPAFTSDLADFVGHNVTPEVARRVQAALGVRTIAAFPLASRGQVLGLMCIWSQAEALDAQQRGFLSACASSIALTVSNIQLYEREHLRAQHLRQLVYNAGTILLPVSASQRMQAIVDQALSLLDADAGALFRVPDANGACEALAYRGLSAAYVRLVGEGGPHAAFARALAMRTPTRALFAFADDDTEENRTVVLSEGIRSVIALPLIARDAFRAVLVLYRRRPEPFSDETMLEAHLYSVLSALSYETMHLMEHSERRLAEVEAMRQVLHSLTDAQSMETAAKAIVEHACRLTDSDSVAFYLWDAARQLLVVQGGTSHGGTMDLSGVLKTGEGVAGVAFETDDRVIVDDYVMWPHRARFSGSEMTGPAMGVPIHVRGETIGALGLLRDIPKRPYDEEDAELAEALADEIAVSVAQAHLSEERDRQHVLMQRVLDAHPSLLLVCEADTTNTVFVNRQFLETTGWTREEVIGRPWVETCIPPAWHRRLQDLAESLRRDQGGLRFSNPILTIDGREIPVQWYNAIVRKEDGQPLYIVANGIIEHQ